MKEEQLYALIEQELRGTLDESNARVLAEWIGQGSQEEATYQEVRSILEITDEGISAIDPGTDESWLALQAMMNGGRSQEDPKEAQEEIEADTPVIQMKPRRTRIYGIAATVILLVVAGLFFAIPGSSPGDDNGQIFASGHGVIKQIDLPDGSHVTLNSESKLEMPGDFNDELRRVKLEGEAFFDIARNEEKPFIIEVMGTETKVLGTSFTISAYPATEQVVVSVVTGLVEFSPIGSDAHLQLKPNQAGRFDLRTNKLIRMETASAEDAAWQEGKFSFRKDPFRIALERLEKHYDLELSVSSELGNELLTTKIDVNSTNEEDMISLLATTMQCKFQRTGKRVEFMK